VTPTLRKHEDLLLNWFRAEGAISSGVVEEFDNKVKLTMKKSNGFRSDQGIQVAIFHALGELPSSKFTPKFC
jgi:transposase